MSFTDDNAIKDGAFISLDSLLLKVADANGETYQETARRLLRLLTAKGDRPIWQRLTHGAGIKPDAENGDKFGRLLLEHARITGQPLDMRRPYEYGFDPFDGEPSDPAYHFLKFGPRLGFLLADIEPFLARHGVKGFDAVAAASPSSADALAPIEIGTTVAGGSINDQPKGSAEARQDARFMMCVDAGLKMPPSLPGRMPNGIAEVAKTAGVSRQTFTDDVKASIERRQGRKTHLIE